MNNVQIFKNDQFGEIRTVNQNGEILFIAVDVCKALDINNARQAISRLDDDEKNTVILNDGIGNPNKNAVNEYGLYNLVLSSRKPEAKAFKRWITHDVIPAIRKTGKYSVEQQVLIEEPSKPGIKYYRGIPVVTKRDLAAALNVTLATIEYMQKKCAIIINHDYYFLNGADLEIFKKENGITSFKGKISSIVVITADGARKICAERNQLDSYYKLFAMAKQAAVLRPIVFDTPDNEQVKKAIYNIRNQITALDVLLNEYNAYNTENLHYGLQESLKAVSMNILNEVNALTKIKLNLIQCKL